MLTSASSPPPRLISDQLWALVEPLIPSQKPAVHGRTGRPRTSARDVLEGIAFVLSSGIGWAKLPGELGYRSGWTCWRRMPEWQQAGLFDQLPQAVLARLGQPGLLDWSRASLDSVSVRAQRGVRGPGRTRPTAARPAARTTCSSTPPAGRCTSPSPAPTGTMACSSHRSWTRCRRSSASAAAILGAGRSSCTQTRAYDNPRVRRSLRRRGITTRIPRIGCDSRQRLGRHRWVVDRSLGWLLSYQRLALRYDRTATITALARLAVTLIYARRLPTN